jgi:hypothetical protein
LTWSWECDWLRERRPAWLVLQYWERVLNTNDWNDFLAAIIFIALSAASGEIANGIYFFSLCCISKRPGRVISVLAFAHSYTYC